MSETNTQILEGLNPQQIEGVQEVEGPVMVIAGAGSGKTRVLTCRVAWLMATYHVDPFRILALTFTNKAATEMQARITKMVGHEARNVWMGTFHSVFAKILRFEGEHLGYEKHFTIYDTDECKSMLKNIIKEMNLDSDFYKPAAVLHRISTAKNNLYSYEQYLATLTFQAQDEEDKRPMIGEIYKNYQVRLKRYNAMDFDDLLFNMNVLLRDFPEVLEKYQRMFQYILVDEYQDTNFSQYVIIKKLAALHCNICVVGDDSQSIYAFRGANIQNILNFQKDYPEAKIIKLEQNYRSTKTIVDASNNIIQNNEHKIPKTVWTDNDEGSLIKIIEADNDREEAVLIANDIFEQKMNNQLMNSDFAILYRTNVQSRALEEALRRRSIPYRILSGFSFYGRKEIKDVLSYFRVIINHDDEEALLRIINYPVRGIGDTTLSKLKTAAVANNVSLWNILENPVTLNTLLPSAMANKINLFHGMIAGFSARLHLSDAFELASSVVKTIGILSEFQRENTPEAINRKENIEELLNAIQSFVAGDITAPGASPGGEFENETDTPRTLDRFMQDIALVSDIDEKDDNPNKVSLMTIHAAKGLEFPYVYLSGLEENLFPNTQMLASQMDLEEERRLFYVAVTRARHQLTLSHAHMRFRWGELTLCEPSRFMDEIDEKLLLGNTKKVSMPSFIPVQPLNNSGVKTKNSNNNSQPAPFNPPATPAKLKRLSDVSARQSKSTDVPSSNIKQGMKVSHKMFGAGTVMSIDGNGDNAKAVVQFDTVGQKTLMLRFAILTEISQ